MFSRRCRHTCTAVSLPFGEVVAETGQSVRNVYFPLSGVISLVVEMQVGDMIETAMVGRDGVVNGTAALDGKLSLHKAIVQVAGEATTIDPEVLRALAHEFGPLQSLLIRHEQVLLVPGAAVGRLQRQSHHRGSYVPMDASDARSDAKR